MSAALEDHPIANIFPLLPEKELAALAEDIKANGVQVPIVLFEGKILDGRNRYRAAQMVGASFVTNYYTGADPVKHVLSLNLHRRHLNDTQRAMVAGHVANIANGGDRVSDQSAKLRTGRVSQPEAAALLNVGVRSVQKAQQIIRNAPERVSELERGETTLNAVTEQIKTPKPAPVAPPSATPIPPTRTKVVVSLGLQIAAVAKGTLDKIIPQDTQRVAALNEIISYAQKRLTENR